MDEFYSSYQLLNDLISKETFVAFINAKISGNSDELYSLYTPNQYFHSSIIRDFSSIQTYIDCGAYNGDTIRVFIDKVKENYKKIYAFEPSVKAYNELSNYVDENKLNKVSIYNKGVGASSCQLNFNTDSTGGEKSFLCKEGEDIIDIVTIDDILQDHEVDFIKMDVEGYELDALKGAENTIKKYHPVLAISVYHKPDDLIKIPFYIKNIFPSYKLYLRNHLHIAQELILYAIP
ncbi:MAG: FkbM family methyltransferase [Sulfurospirillum cavolei]|nr:FkbM family methyltransferase [Sulfurospirillum cavolei]